MELSKLIGMLPKVSHPNLLVDINTADDAGVYKLTDSIALVQTIDVFTPVVDDPYDFGRISAANSLSDVFAMGGKPVTALNFVGYPHKILSLEILAEILRGAYDKTQEADCPIVGGHTIMDDELKFGLSVTGVVHPDKIIKNCEAKPGDKLILTKPLGTGILSTALKSGKLDQNTTRKITEVMSQLNKIPSELMVKYQATAATDITGFGLLGHTNELAKELPDVKFMKVNVSTNSALANKYGIRSIPQLLFFKDGNLQKGATLRGNQTKDTIKRAINKLS